MVQLIMTRNLKRRILSLINRLYTRLFPPKFLEEQWGTGQDELVETSAESEKQELKGILEEIDQKLGSVLRRLGKG